MDKRDIPAWLEQVIHDAVDGLGDDAARPSIIETVRSVGYRFLPPPA